MEIVETDVLIIGGGLTGLTTAYFLGKENIRVKIVEARPRLGGRIKTIYSDHIPPMEMGATWVGKKHTALLELLATLGIGIFDQTLGERAIYEAISTSPPQVVQLPPNTDPTFRIQGGTSKLINTLANQLTEDQIYTAQPIQSIEKRGTVFIVKSEQVQFQAKFVISTLPPYLLAKTIDFKPALPANLMIILSNTHTWMGESIKIGLTYEKPFWRTSHSSGTIISNVGPIPEMYDHSNVEDTRFGLIGFFSGTYFSVSREKRLSLILNQLQKYYGTKANDYLMYEETVWRKEQYTFAPYGSHLLPHQNNGHSIFREAFLDGQFFIAGAETAPTHPGYMDGAVFSAKQTYQEVVKVLATLE